MKKHFLEVLSLAVVSVLALSQTAKADVMDPVFQETLTNSCPANCGSVTTAMDPISGKTTLEYIFNSTIPSVVAGDLKIQEFGSSTIGDLIRFENGNTSAYAFIFSNDIAGGLTADVGLPATFQANVAMTSETSNGGTVLYTPTSGQPGFCASCTTTPPRLCSSKPRYSRA